MSKVSLQRDKFVDPMLQYLLGSFQANSCCYIVVASVDARHMQYTGLKDPFHSMYIACSDNAHVTEVFEPKKNYALCTTIDNLT